VSLATMNLTLRDLSLPGGVFHPYLGVKTSVLLFRKAGRTERVLFLHADADGYKLDSNHDTPGEIGDLPGLVKAYQSRLGSLAAWQQRKPQECWPENWWCATTDKLRDRFHSIRAALAPSGA
jgi:type I restriction enzyme M protein